jgi:7-cyano-7-deazaguanine synthase in queuosine biosynthesis
MSLENVLIISLAALLASAILFGTIYYTFYQEEKAKYQTCEVEIAAQNAAEKTANAEQVAVQKSVNASEVNNASLTTNLIQQEKTIATAPILTDCDKATAWGARQASMAASHFHSG